MSDNEPTTDHDDDSPNFKRLREKVQKLEAENVKLRETAAQNMLKAAGFDPSQKLTGLVLNQYLADPESELSADAFKSFAQEYQLPTTGTADTGDTPQGGPDHSDALDQLQQGADQLRQATSQANANPSIDEQIRSAEAEGDFARAGTLKTHKIRQAIVANR